MASADRIVRSSRGSSAAASFAGSRLLVITAGLVLVAGVCVAMAAAAATSGGGTTSPDPTARTSSTLDQINKSNVGQLEVAWFYPYGDDRLQPDRRRRRDVRARAASSSLVALDATTGKEIWIHEGLDRHHRPRHQLLAERGRQGQAADLLDQQLPPGDRRHDRQVDPDVRRRRRRRSARGPAARRGHGVRVQPTAPARSGRTC